MNYQDNAKRIKERRAAAESGADVTAAPKAASTNSKSAADEATEEVQAGRSFFGKVGVFCKWASIPTAIALCVFLYFFVPMWQEAGQKLEGKTIQDLFQMESAEAGVFTQDGKLLAVLGENKPEFVPYEKLNQKAKDALLAVEDRSYFSFWRLLVPFDPIGIFRAGVTNIQTGEVRAGGSTIIQMLARTLFVGREKTFKRKLRELAYSYQLIIRYKREDLLAVFMNRADFGAVNGQKVVGFIDAPRAFYRVELDQLTPDQLATVVGVLNATTAFNPVYHPAASKIRRNVVLAAWEDAGFISKIEQTKLAALPVQANPRDVIKKYGDYPNAVKAALAELEEIGKQLLKNGVELPAPEELRIDVTYDSVVLEAWKQAFLDEAKNLPAGTKAAGGVIDYRNGETLAMFGGTDFLNRFISAQRQPGSVFKLFVYALALAKGKITPDTVFTDEARVFENPGSKPYAPENHDGFSGQQMTVAQALASSKNVIACEVAEQVGYDNIVNFARELGLEIVKDGKGNLRPTPAITLGSYEVTMPQLLSALSILANGGQQVPVHYIRKVTGPDGTVLYTADMTATQRIDWRVAAAMTQMMVGVATDGTGKGIFPGLIALKTGSSFDGWLVGFTPGGLLFAIYVGYDDPQNHKTSKIFGATTAGKPAKNFLARLSKVESQKHWFAGKFPAMPSNADLAKAVSDAAAAQPAASVSPTPSPSPSVSPSPTITGGFRMPTQEQIDGMIINTNPDNKPPVASPTLRPIGSPSGAPTATSKPSPTAKPSPTPSPKCGEDWRVPCPEKPE